MSPLNLTNHLKGRRCGARPEMKPAAPYEMAAQLDKPKAMTAPVSEFSCGNGASASASKRATAVHVLTVL